VKSSNGKAIIVHEANLTGGFGAEISARISSRLFGELKAPVLRLGVPDSRIPASPIMQKALIPDVPKIVDAIRKVHAL
jgi:pyruvate/2-oxoglutarate/acetoin dehydrogenase E1 component